MSCVLNKLGQFQDISTVRSFLLNSPANSDSHLEPTSTNAIGDWEDDWTWNEDGNDDTNEAKQEDAGNNKEGSITKDDWLQDCCVSLSPANDLLAIAYEEKAIFLQQKWDPDETEGAGCRYHVIFKGTLIQEEGECITTVMCIPLASQQRSSQGMPDWTCVIVGFTTGYVRMYTENGALLLSQLLHEDPVLKLKCRTHDAPRYPGIAEQPEELSILFPTSLVLVDGFSLFQSLRACRNQLARAHASGTDAIQPPPLAYKKWGLQNQDVIEDQVSCGVITPCAFDQLHTASILGGYSAAIKSNAPICSRYLSVGSSPFVGVFDAVEGSTQPLMSDVAFAVASKLKSALISAARSLIWYRDAQCGWIQVKEDIHKEKSEQVKSPKRSRTATFPRLALFLVIYAPRRGILEVWNTQQGPRVAAFNVPKSCRLLAPGHGILGYSHLSVQDSRRMYKQLQCVLMEPSGLIRTIYVPFHLALSDKNSKKARDMHLVKKLSSLLHNRNNLKEPLEQAITPVLLDIKIASYKQQGLNKILATRNVPSMVQLYAMESLAAQLRSQEPNSLDYESQCLLQFCQAQKCLLKSYNGILKINSVDMEERMDEGSVETLAETLAIDAIEIKQFQEQIDNYLKARYQSKVHFEDKPQFMDTSQFLQCFEVKVEHRLEIQDEKDVDTTMDNQPQAVIKIKQNLSDEVQTQLGAFLFRACLTGESAVQDLFPIIEQLSIPIQDFLDLMKVLLVKTWLGYEEKLLRNCESFCHLHRFLTLFSEAAKKSKRDDFSSWIELQDIVLNTKQVGAALVVAMVIKSVLGVSSQATTSTDQQMETDVTEATSDQSASVRTPELGHDWVNILGTSEAWRTIVNQLHDVTSLCCLLNTKPTKDIVTPMEKGDTVAWTASQDFGVGTQTPLTDITLKTLLDGGRDIFAELLGKWVVKYSVSPSFLSNCSLVQRSMSNVSDTEMVTMDTEADDEGKRHLQKLLSDLLKRLPYSLEHDSIQAHCCWEYIVQWNKSPEATDMLAQGLEHLKMLQNASLRQGVATLMWSTFLVKRVSAAAYLMDKVGKAPKDRLCRKEVGLSDVTLQKFMGSACDLFEVIQLVEGESTKPPVFRIEDLWQVIQGSTPLMLLASYQQPPNQQLVSLHKQLCTVMHAIMKFTMKSVKPLQYFDAPTKSTLFKELSGVPQTPEQNFSLALMEKRQEFLNKLIVSSFNDVTPNHEEDSTASTPEVIPVSPSASFMIRFRKCGPASIWPAVAQQLALIWNVDVDMIKRLHSLQLYSCGYDTQAEEVLTTVSEQTEFATQLMEVVGQRLHYITIDQANEVSVEKLTSVPANLMSWIKTKDSSLLKCRNVPLADTVQLIGKVVGLLPENHSLYTRAISLFETCNALAE
ncbi:rab3 GTPase-activating protein non-catalytic subunit-like [Anneissia japonica]|uniref:rab3 GTPase-activating protein non-catalytic subunit-like n=1 Tax=Anneissia japonica TaxID=1529436 RepID=UPI001425B513|nr:rab3 GTPase-activating protein non-catalytic subunit-like [Anneissia japonica]